MTRSNYIALNLEQTFITNIQNILDDVKNILNTNGYVFEKSNLSDLHMTLVFLGNILLTDKSNKLIKIDDKINYFTNNFNGLTLEFDQFDFFNSRNKNLIVMKFKCNDPNFIKNMILYKNSFVELGAKKENYFTPHITLGKIKSSQTNVNATDIKNILNVSTIKPATNIEINGCYLV